MTGLSAAYHNKEGVVYEKEKVAVGHGKSHTVNGYIFDEGIHVVHTNDKDVLDLYEKLGVKFLIKKREAWIYSWDTLTRYPFQANTHGLPVNIVKDCLLGFIQNDFGDRSKIKNYEDWIYCIFGKGIAEHFMIPYAQKFWGVHPRELMTDWVDIRHPKPSLEEILEGALHEQTKGFGVNAEFRYPERGGFGAIGEVFAKQVEGRLHLGRQVTGLEVHKKRVEFNHSETVSYDQLLSTMPLPDLVRCIPDAPQDVKDAAGKLRTNSILVVNIGLNRTHISEKHWIYYHEKKYPFFRISFTENYASDTVPVGKSAIAAEVAYNRETNPLNESHEEIATRVVASLKELGIIRGDDEILFTYTIDIKYAYVIHDKYRIPAVQCIHEYLKRHEIYPCGRYGDWGYLWSHDAVVRGRDVALELKNSRILSVPSSGDARVDGNCGCVTEFSK